MIAALARLAPRERALVALLVFGVVPLGLWFGVLAPLQERAAAAEARRAEAHALALWVAERAAEMPAPVSEATPGPADPAAVPPPIGTAGIEASLRAARLRPVLSALEAQEGGRLALRFDAVAFQDLMRWITRADPGWGYTIRQLRLTARDAPGMVEARIVLEPAG